MWTIFPWGSLNSRCSFSHSSDNPGLGGRVCVVLLPSSVSRSLLFHKLTPPLSFLCLTSPGDFSFLWGHQSYWIRPHPNDFLLITSIKTLCPNQVILIVARGQLLGLIYLKGAHSPASNNVSVVITRSRNKEGPEISVDMGKVREIHR